MCVGAFNGFMLFSFTPLEGAYCIYVVKSIQKGARRRSNKLFDRDGLEWIVFDKVHEMDNSFLSFCFVLFNLERNGQ